MNANLKFNKALYLLDAGKLDAGERLLLEAAGDAELEGDLVTVVQSSVVLGEFLLQAGREGEARTYLEKALAVETDDDVVSYETDRARQLLSSL